MAKGNWKPFNSGGFFKSISGPPKLLMIHTLGGKTISGSLASSDDRKVVIANGTTKREVEFSHGVTLTFFQWVDYPQVDITESDPRLTGV